VGRYAAALAEVVRPSDVVLDLASGTSVLGMLACRAGAARVYSVEADEIAGVARRLAAANCGDGLTVIRAHSSEASLPEPADLVVSDQIGRFGFDAGLLSLMHDARTRLLRPEARFVPSAIALAVAPVESARLAGRVAFWSRPRAGLDLSSVVPLAANTIYPARLAAGSLLGAPHHAAPLDLSRDAPASLDVDATIAIERDGRLDGVAGWFVAQLSPSVTMSNAPTDARRIRRRQAFMPVASPLQVRRGDRVTVSVRALWRAMVVSWRVSVHRDGQAPVHFAHSTLQGMLLDAAMLRAGDPASRPALTERGVARRTILELCDGTRTLDEIEAAVFARHRALFASREEAAVFVGEVVSRYTRDAG
jgi:protein arginine N-methyltransferase 1